MVDANLRHLLAEALPYTPPATLTDFALTVLLQEADGGRITPHTSVTALLDCLRKDPELAMFHGRTQVVADVGRGVTHVFLGEWLLRRAGTEGPNQAVTDLERYLSTERLPYRATIAVGGITPDRAYDLGHGMQLMPWKDIPNTSTKRAISEAAPFHRSFYHPDGALTREVELQRIHVDHSEARKYLRATDWSDITDMLLCLGLFGPTAPVLLASWLEPPEWAPVLTGAYSMPFVEGSGARRPFPTTAPVEASRVFSTWLALSEGRRTRLRVPMERLNTAIRRKSSVDSAIDLGIALESIFLGDELDELSFRLRVRAARWLGATPDERQKVSALIRDLYAARSKAVHRGLVQDSIKNRPTADLLEEGFRLTATGLVELIRSGDPDWDAVTYG